MTIPAVWCCIFKISYVAISKCSCAGACAKLRAEALAGACAGVVFGANPAHFFKTK